MHDDEKYKNILNTKESKQMLNVTKHNFIFQHYFVAIKFM